jgi:hypothetical protein
MRVAEAYANAGTRRAETGVTAGPEMELRASAFKRACQSDERFLVSVLSHLQAVCSSYASGADAWHS